jgi:hypothetical protein
MTHSTTFSLGQVCQIGGPPPTCISWLVVAEKLSEQPKRNSFTYEHSFEWNHKILLSNCWAKVHIFMRLHSDRRTCNVQLIEGSTFMCWDVLILKGIFRSLCIVISVENYIFYPAPITVILVQLLLSNYTLNNLPNNVNPKSSAAIKLNVYIMRFVHFNKNWKWNSYFRKLRTIILCVMVQLVEAQRYKQEGCEFDSRWYH